jgi:hypothetical protein
MSFEGRRVAVDRSDWMRTARVRWGPAVDRAERAGEEIRVVFRRYLPGRTLTGADALLFERVGRSGVTLADLTAEARARIRALEEERLLQVTA